MIGPEGSTNWGKISWPFKSGKGPSLEGLSTGASAQTLASGETCPTPDPCKDVCFAKGSRQKPHVRYAPSYQPTAPMRLTSPFCGEKCIGDVSTARASVDTSWPSL